MKTHPLYLNGEFVTTGDSLPILNPATGEPFARMAVCPRATVARALEAAHTAFAGWRNVSGKSRGDFLLKTAASDD